MTRLARCSLATLLCLGTPAMVWAQTAQVRYERALSAEQKLRSSAPTLAALRAAAKSYEDIVRRYPVSGYADNALWQAAGLLKLAFDRFADVADRRDSERLLKWLRREYPASSLGKNADAMLGALPPIETPLPGPLPPQPPTVAPLASPTALPPAAAAASGPPASIRNITYSRLPRGDRLIVELNQEAAFAGDRVDTPDRLFFDFSNASVTGDLATRAAALTGTYLKNVRIGRPAQGVTRVVLELGGPSRPRYSAFPLYSPFRLVIDLESAEPAPPAPPAVQPATPLVTTPILATPSPAAPPPPIAVAVKPPPDVPAAPAPASTSRGDYSIPRQLGLGVSRVVIDPGHGGHDPGAQAFGINEAELVLDVSQRIAKLLAQKPGFEVVLTREKDEFIPLEERTAIATREDADLFLSIHANASKNPAARGIETYFLNFATNPDAEAVAARENATSAQAMSTLPAILKAIALNSKREESRELATIVQTSLLRRLRNANATTRDLGVKTAPFVVLIGATVPSVLAEISFITNRTDAGLLKQTSYRQQIAQAIVDALVKYQTSLKKVTTTSSLGR